jgi:hypothetical protein
MAHGATHAELGEWAQLGTALNLNITRSATQPHRARRAAPLIWPEYSSPNLPRAVQTIITETIEVGYAQALSDIQDGVRQP